jgi:nucleotidyltransferase/DNA polymerase involved in DNA repair
LTSKWGNFLNILVWEKDGDLISLEGETKLNALRENGNQQANVIVLPIKSETEATEFALEWSSLTKTSNNITIALLIKQLLDKGVQRKTIINMLGVSKSWLSKKEKLANNLNINIYDLVKNDILSIRTAESISRLQDKEQQLIFAKNIIDNHLNKNQVDKLVALFNNKNTDENIRDEIIKSPNTVILSNNHYINIRKRKTSIKKNDLTFTTNSFIYTNNHIIRSTNIVQNMNNEELNNYKSHLEALQNSANMLCQTINNLLKNKLSE